MSWNWSAGAPPMPSAVTAPTAGTLLPGAINPAPAVMPSTLQYSPEQWAQAQQQNWQQWATWQQQFQQWQQRYGAEYQTAMQGLTASTHPPLASIVPPTLAPPLPTDSKPPLPPEEPPTGHSQPPSINPYASMPPALPPSGYNTAPPPFQKLVDQQQNSMKIMNALGQKRPHPPDLTSNVAKKSSIDNGSSYQWQSAQSQWPMNNQQFTQPPPSIPKPNIEELSEAEKKFDKEFAAWEAQFNKWKEQNANHPDKTQYREYEKKWESWRNSLLERREQMRKKRLSLTASNSVSNSNKTSQSTPTSQQPPTMPISGSILNAKVLQAGATQAETLQQNNDFHNLKQSATFQSHIKDDGSTSFLNSSSTSDRIPGLDLVREDDNKNEKEEIIELDREDEQLQQKVSRESQKGPDFDAISKGINNILGDQKLLSILSMVSRNPPGTPGLNLSSNAKANIIFPKDNYGMSPHTSTSREGYSGKPPIFSEPPPPAYNEKSSHSFEDKSGPDDYHRQRESVTNFDDQTRSSFTMGNGDQDLNYRNRYSPKRFGGGMAESDRFPIRNTFCSDNRQSDEGSSRNERFIEIHSRNDNFGVRGKPYEDLENAHLEENDSFLQNTRFDRTEEQYYGNDGRFSFERPSGNFDQAENPYGKNFSHTNFDEYEHYEDDYDRYHDMYNEDEEQYNTREERMYEKENIDLQKPSKLLNFQPPSVTENLEDPIFEPATVIDYDHKSKNSDDIEVTVEPFYAFDYRHKPLNRIPYSQRPKWLVESVKFIREFDPLASLNTTNQQYDRSFFDRRIIERNDDRYVKSRLDNNWDRADRFNRAPYIRRDNRDGPDFNRRKPVDIIKKEHRTNDLPEEQSIKSSDKKHNIKDDFEELSDDDMDWERDEGKRSHLDQSDENEKCPETGILLRNPSNFSNLKTSKETMIEDIVNPPGRFNRPPRIVIILRGPPGSGKTYLAKLIKDKEIENGGSAPRILSLDDYFMVEQEREVVIDGKRQKVKEMIYEYEADMEESYRASFIKSFKKTITDGYFPFIIVDNVNEKVKYFGEMWSFAKQNGFHVYICQMDLDPVLCTKRNIHNRTEKEIEDCISGWEPTPDHHPTLDASSLLQSSITEVEMEDEIRTDSKDESTSDKVTEDVARSKWDSFDCSYNTLAKLDGVSKPIRKSETMEEYLRIEHEWEPSQPTKPGQKRVRWADLEEQRKHAKMRAIGFTIGTDWNKMMNTSDGSSALTQTKYIERVTRH